MLCFFFKLLFYCCLYHCIELELIVCPTGKITTTIRAQTILFFHFQMCCCVERRTLSIRHVKRMPSLFVWSSFDFQQTNVISFGSRICFLFCSNGFLWQFYSSVLPPQTQITKTNKRRLALVGCVLKLTCVLTNRGPVVKRKTKNIYNRTAALMCNLDYFVGQITNIGSNVAIREEKILENFFRHIFVCSGHFNFILFAKCNCVVFGIHRKPYRFMKRLNIFWCVGQRKCAPLSAIFYIFAFVKCHLQMKRAG